MPSDFDLEGLLRAAAEAERTRYLDSRCVDDMERRLAVRARWRRALPVGSGCLASLVAWPWLSGQSALSFAGWLVEFASPPANWKTAVELTAAAAQSASVAEWPASLSLSLMALACIGLLWTTLTD